MALIDLHVRRGYIGGSYGLLRITLGRVSLEGYRDAEEGPDTPFVWFEGLRREAMINEEGRTLSHDREWLVGNDDTIAGFPVLS